MKHNRNQGKKISKEFIKKGSTTLVLLFFAMVMIFQKDTQNSEFQFVRNDNPGFIHNAAKQQRDYLFQDESGQESYQGQIYTGNTTGTTAINKSGATTTGTIDTGINPDKITQATGNTQTGQIYTGTLSTGSVISGTQIVENTASTIQTGTLDCITPWKEKVKHQDFVLAYQQRKDVNSMCNIEKRICTNGILGGSFTQSSCKENTTYVYRKAEVVSYNQKVINEYIQPAEPVNAGAEFNNEGKINTTERPTNTWGTTNSPVITKSGVVQTPLSDKANCTTPRGQKIKHGQFIKAYKAPRGFIDLACDVEIRPCINGDLKGTFTYSKCTFNNTSYTDYINAGGTQASTKFLFFERIKGLR